MFGSSSWLEFGNYLKKIKIKIIQKFITNYSQVSALDLNAEQERFNDLHYQIDYWLRNVRINSSALINQLNKDALTTIGERVAEAGDLKEATQSIIGDVVLDLGELNQCAIDADEFLTQSAIAAGVSLSACAEQTVITFNAITNENVIPYSSYVQRRSTTASHFTLTALAAHNPITETTELAAFLTEAFDSNEDAWENYAKLIMESELEYLEQLGSEAVVALEICVDSAITTLVTITNAIAASVVLCEA